MKKTMLMLMIVLLVAANVGCSKLQCWYGDCKQIQSRSQTASIVSANAESTDAELAIAIRGVADYYADLLDNSKVFGGLLASPAYHDVLVRKAANYAEVADRAEQGKWSRAKMVSALFKAATHLSQLQAGMAGEK